MKLNFALLRSRWHTPALLAAGFLPLPLLLCARMTPDRLWSGLPVVPVYLIAAWLCIVMPGRRRLAAAIPGAAAIVLAGLLLTPWRSTPALLVVPAAYVALLVAGLVYADGEPGLAFPAVGLLLHIAAQVLQLADSAKGMSMPWAAICALRLAFVAYGFLILYALNRSSLREAAAKGSAAPLTVKRRNLLLTLGLGGITMLIACLPAVIRFFERIWGELVEVVRRIIAFLAEMIASDDPASGGVMPGDLGGMMGEANDPSPLWRILERILMVVGLLVAAVLAVLVLRMLWRKLRQLAQVLMARLQEFARAASEDYQDEISDTREGGERVSILHWIAGKRDPLRGIDWMKLPPRERIRFYYLRAWLKRPEWEAGQTVRENLPPETAEIYERARYSQYDMTEPEAEEFGRRVTGK